MLRNLRHPATVISIIAVFISLSGGAIAAKLITGKGIRNGSLVGKDVKNQSLKKKDVGKGAVGGSEVRNGSLDRADFKPGVLDGTGAGGQNGSSGTNGSTGPVGPTGPQGPQGTASYVGDNWSTIFRNTIGSPTASLAAGPNAVVGGTVVEPPFGQGSLNITTANFGASGNAEAEKASFGNQVDYAGKPFNGLNQLGFRVFTTGENAAKGNPNMPNITIEIDPNLASTPSNFSSLVFQPLNSTANTWSGYIDATTVEATQSGQGFYLSGAAGTATGCTLADTCTFQEVKSALNDGDDQTTVLTVAVTKGRDFAFQGAVDGLRIGGLGNGDQTFDFEPFGTSVSAG